jgi:hypothetical protein
MNRHDDRSIVPANRRPHSVICRFKFEEVTARYAQLREALSRPCSLSLKDARVFQRRREGLVGFLKFHQCSVAGERYFDHRNTAGQASSPKESFGQYTGNGVDFEIRLKSKVSFLESFNMITTKWVLL